jgi:hypothetical protein
MKTPPKPTSGGSIPGKTMTLGDLIASTYNACGNRAPKLLQLALEAQLIRIKYGL